MYILYIGNKTVQFIFSLTLRVLSKTISIFYSINRSKISIAELATKCRFQKIIEQNTKMQGNKRPFIFESSWFFIILHIP